MYRSEGITNLCAAVSDANAMYDFLRVEMHVPERQIVMLRDGEATRDAIIGELQALGRRKDIRRGDPILIYFAGHGTRAASPPGWKSGSDKISLLVPHDCMVEDENGEIIQPIPDRYAQMLMTELP